MSQRVDKDSLALDKPRRTPGHPTKSHIVKTRVDGKEKIIRFGEQGASTAGKPKEGESERMKAKRASFKSRHAKNIAKGKSSPAYWANKVKWADGGPVELLDMAAKYDEGGDVDVMDYLRSVGGTLSSLPEAPRAIYEVGKRAVQAAPEAARSALQYIQRSTPQQVAQDVTGGLTRAARYVRDNPISTIADFIPVVGDIKAYGEDVARAAAMRARGDVRGAQGVEQFAIPMAMASILPGVGEARKAVIRSDDIFRGVGTPKITVDQTDKPFVVRTTTQDQIDDMIASGLVRPKPGGYGKQQTPQIYFGESETAEPSGVFGRPAEGGFAIVGKSGNLVGKEGPIPIDQLEHIWENRGGELVDILPDIIRRNQEFAPASPLTKIKRKLITKPERGPVLPGPGETDILYRGAAPSEGRLPFIPDNQRQGVTWFSSDPKVASEYAYTTNYDPELDGPTVTPVRLKPSNMMDVDAQGNTYTNIPLPDEYYDTDIDDYVYDPAEMYGEDTGGTLMISTDKLAQLATDLDYDAVRMKNIIDYGPGADEAGRSRVADTYAAFDPSIVIPMAGRMNERKTNLDRFLKESIMKDEAGDPVVLFHGTSDDVTGNFNLRHPNRKDSGWLGRGAYVTDSPELASMYSSMKAGKAGANVMPLYGDIRNPYNMTLKEKNQLRFLSQDDIDDFTSKLRDAGHDSAIVTYPDGVREIAVFDPERQLKSASGNRGTYDSENPDLKYAKGGLVDYDSAHVDSIIDGVLTGKYAQGGLVQYDPKAIDDIVNQIHEGMYG